MSKSWIWGYTYIYVDYNEDIVEPMVLALSGGDLIRVPDTCEKILSVRDSFFWVTRPFFPLHGTVHSNIGKTEMAGTCCTTLVLWLWFGNRTYLRGQFILLAKSGKSKVHRRDKTNKVPTIDEHEIIIRSEEAALAISFFTTGSNKDLLVEEVRSLVLWTIAVKSKIVTK